MMAIPIAVPYSQKDDAKDCGAICNASQKTWMIPDDTKDLNPFGKWLPKVEKVVVKRPYFLLESQRCCWKCQQMTPVIALAADNFFSFSPNTDEEPTWSYHKHYAVFYEIQTIEPSVLAHIQSQYPFFQKTFSRTLHKYYFGNLCTSCRSLQGEFFLIHEDDSPFFPDQMTGKVPAVRRELPVAFDFFIGGTWESQTGAIE